MLGDALAWHAHGPPQPLLRGDELARELAIPTGPRIGQLLAELAAAQYAGEIATREEALARARELLGEPGADGA
jgi:poly(A) polymerase